jgi:hypothetical protein
VQADERIKHEQARLELGDGLVEVCAVSLEIEPHGGRSDHLHVEIGERQYYIV